MNPKPFIEAGTFLVDAAVGKRASELLAEEAATLTRRTAEKLWQSTTPQAKAETIRTLADIIQGRPGDVVTAVPRRIISGSIDGTINARTVSIDVLGPSDLMKRIASQPSNADLLKEKLVNGLPSRRLHYLSPDYVHEQTHITLSLGNRIVGIGGVRTNPSDASQLWMEHLSVETKHQGKGYARNIIESIYDYALRRNQQVVPSSFTRDGQRLKPIFNRLDERYPQAASGIPHRDF